MFSSPDINDVVLISDDRPLKISYGGFSTSVGKDYLETVGKIDKARCWDDERDATDFHHVNVYNVSGCTLLGVYTICIVVLSICYTPSLTSKQRWRKYV